MLIQSSYRPPPLLSNPHLQTLVGGLGNRYQRIPDPVISCHEGTGGDFYELATWRPSGPSTGRLVLLHGLEGSLRSGYLRSTLDRLVSEGCFTVELLFFRGCGPSVNRFPRSYHSGFTDDLRQHLASDPRPTVLVGFSIGGNVILKFLGEEGSSATRTVRCAIAISPPGNLEATASAISKRPLYQNYFISSFREKHRKKVAMKIAEPSFGNFENIISFYDYDSAYTAPLFGYDSAEEYWGANSSCRFIPSIQVPCLVICALDDPFFSHDSIPIEECRKSKVVDLELSERGGHVGFLSSYWGPTYAEKKIVQYAHEAFRGG